MKKIYKVTVENGYYLFKLEQVLADKKISINKAMRDTGTDFKVIKRLSTGDLARIDITILARFCNYLECEVKDIFEYVPKENNTN